MLSIVLYGRNDSHGYNYHKRLAISLNCISEMLSHADDEIIFIDYNSTEDAPTILEAIADTLTEKTKSLLKIYRIRLQQYLGKNSALSGEPFARNAAIRRSNPSNKWILSTNVDMVFVPVNPKETLSALVANLPERFYELPRFELPENLWESQFDRLKPKEILSFLRTHALEMQLNTIVRRPGFLVYDNPGDFQLIPRKVIFRVHGFNEQMQQGWHLDSNLCKRMSLYYNDVAKSLEDKLWGYHCNHTRQETFSHMQFAPENNWHTYISKINTPYIPEQSNSWGFANKNLEEIVIKKPCISSFFKSSRPPSDFSIDQGSFNTLTYDSARIFIHLSDHFYHLPTGSKVVYFGYNKELLQLIRIALPSVLVEGDIVDLYEKAAVMIFDFGFDQKNFKGIAVTPSDQLYKDLKDKLKNIMKQFLQVIELEKRQKKNVKFIGINVLFTDFYALFHHHLTMRKTTFLTGISFGYLRKKHKKKHKRSFYIKKKQIKMYFMYVTVRYCYRFTDRVRQLIYQVPVVKRMLQLK